MTITPWMIRAAVVLGALWIVVGWLIWRVWTGEGRGSGKEERHDS